MLLLECKDSWTVSNAKEFVAVFDLRDEFKDLTGEDVSEWEPGTGASDEEIIAELLEKLEGYYFFEYRSSNLGWFQIWKLGKTEERGGASRG